MFALACIKPRTATVAGLPDCLPLPVALKRSLYSTAPHCTFSLCFDSQNKIEWFIPSEHNNILVYNHQHPSIATCFGLFLDHPQANVSIVEGKVNRGK